MTETEALHVRCANGRNAAKPRCKECGFRWPCLTVQIARGEATTETENPLQ